MADSPTARSDLPTGTVTFLRTDVEGSMGLARTLGTAWDEIVQRHLELIGAAVAAHGGTVIRTEGDAVFAGFPEAIAAVAAAVEIQRALAAETWPAGVTVRVRVGLHTGEAHRSGDDYGGFDVNRAARVAAVGHGGQVVLSETTAALVADALPTGTTLRDLGRHVLKDVPRAERLSQVDIAGLPCEFPPLRTAAERIGNLPDRLTSFIGREEELAALVTLVRDARLVTLTGPGGIGKTSLAIETARALAPEFRDGAWFISLGDRRRLGAGPRGDRARDRTVRRPRAASGIGAAVVPGGQIDGPRPRQHGAPAGGRGRGRRGGSRVAGQSRPGEQPRAIACRRGARGPGGPVGRRRGRSLHRACPCRQAGLGPRRRRATWSPRSVACWTTCRWGSSSPPPASDPSHRP